MLDISLFGPSLSGSTKPAWAVNPRTPISAASKLGLMAHTLQPSTMNQVEHGRQLRRAVLASTIGTAIEWYDFFLYSTVTGLVFAHLYFPRADPLVGTVEAFGVYAVGFLARPIGAAIFGHYGDRLGRKAALVATLLLMGIGTFLVALVPALYSGHRCWWGMGRFGASVHGMGAVKSTSRLYHIVAAVRRTSGTVSLESGRARHARAIRRAIHKLGLASAVPG